MTTIWIVSFAVLGAITLLTLSLSLYILFFFKKLSKDVGRENLVKILGKALEIEKQNSENILKINKFVDEIKKDAMGHFQKTALVRFNPFSEMGGDHSFSLALLDAHLSGFVITGLHTRDRTRVYAKKIDKGSCKQELSNEEKQALEKASR